MYKIILFIIYKGRMVLMNLSNFELYSENIRTIHSDILIWLKLFSIHINYLARILRSWSNICLIYKNLSLHAIFTSKENLCDAILHTLNLLFALRIFPLPTFLMIWCRFQRFHLYHKSIRTLLSYQFPKISRMCSKTEIDNKFMRHSIIYEW